MARESWLRLDNENHDQFAEAMLLCQDASGSCVHTGKCSFDGDCFRTEVKAYNEAARLIDGVAKDKSELIRSALLEASMHMRTLARAAKQF